VNACIVGMIRTDGSAILSASEGSHEYTFGVAPGLNNPSPIREILTVSAVRHNARGLRSIFPSGWIWYERALDSFSRSNLSNASAIRSIMRWLMSGV
jgi:hypothetical protein